MESEKLPHESRQHCPHCGSGEVVTRPQRDTFVYGVGPNAVELPVTVPLHTCRNCGFQFLDSQAEDIQHEAVCRHLGVMPPGKIRALRKARGLSRSEFARITKLGEATLARWERGELVQNAAYDQLLYLLKFDDNWARLKKRDLPLNGSGQDPVSDGREPVASNLPCPGINRIQKNFPHLRDAEKASSLARAFQIAPGVN